MFSLYSLPAGILFIFLALAVCFVALVCVVAVPYTIIHRLRLGFKFLFKSRWELWYVRRALDTAILGFIALFGAWVSCSPRAGGLVWAMGKAGYLTSSQVTSLLYYHNEDLSKVADNLMQLQALEFFWSHFFQIVVVPSFLVGFAGYTIERSCEKKRKMELVSTFQIR